MAKLILEIDGKDAEAVAKAVGAAVEKAGGKVKVLSEEEKKLAQSFKDTTGQMSRQNAGLATILDKVKRGELSVRSLATAERVAAEAARLHVDVMSAEGRQLAKLIEEYDRLQKELRETAAGMDRVDAEAGGAAGGLGRFAAGALALSAALGLKEALIGIVEIAGRYEGLRTQLQTVVGSADGAAAAFQRLTAFATKTPFEVENLTTAFIRLKAVGIEPTDDLMTSMGDTAAAFGRDIVDYTQAVIGATTGEMEMLKAFGIVAKVEGDKVRFLFKGIETEVARNATSIVDYLKTLGETNFAGGMERQAATMNGAISNVKDAWAGIADAVGQGGLTEAISEIAREMAGLLTTAEGQEQAAEFGRRLAEALRLLADVAKDLLPLANVLGAILSLIDRIALAKDKWRKALGLDNVSIPLLPVLWALGKAAGWLNDQLAMVPVAMSGYDDAMAKTQGLFPVWRALGKEIDDVKAKTLDAAQAQVAMAEAALAAFTAVNTQIGAATSRLRADIAAAQSATGRDPGMFGSGERRVTIPKEAARLLPDLAGETVSIREAKEALRQLEQQQGNVSVSGNNLQRTLQLLRENLSSLANGEAPDLSDELQKIVDKLKELNAELAIKIRQTGEEIKATADGVEAVRRLKAAHEAENAIRATGASLTALEIRQIQAGIPLRDALKQGIVEQTLAVSNLNKELEKEQARLAAKGKIKELMLKVTVDTSTLDKQMAEASKKAVELDLQQRREVFEWQKRNEQVYTDQREQANQQQLQDAADYFRSSLVTPREELGRLMDYIDLLARTADDAGRPLLSAAEAERLRARAAEEFASQAIDQWVGFLSMLGDSLGGAFEDLAKIGRSIQGVNSTAQSLGGWSSMAGAFGGVIAAFVALYEYGNSVIQKHKSEKYGARTAYTLTNEVEGLSYQLSSSPEMKQASTELLNAIRDAVSGLEDALRISVKDLAQIEIRVRNDGKLVQAWVKGVWLGTFTDTNAAIQAALLAALKDPSSTFSGMTDLIRQGLGEWNAPDAEGLMDFLSALRQIDDLGLTDGAVQVQQTLTNLDQLWQTLARMRDITPAVVQGFENILAAELRTWQAWSDQITGRRKTPAEDLAARRAEAILFNAQRLLRLEELKLRKTDLESQLKYLEGKGKGVAGGIGLWKVDLEAHGAYLKSKGELTQAELEIYNQSVEGLKAIISALDGVIAAFPAAIDLGSITVPRSGGSGGSKKDEVRDFLEEKRLSRLGPIAQDFARLNKEYDEQAKKAKGNADLLAKVNAERQREIDLLGQRVRADLITPYLGPAGSAGRSTFSSDEAQIAKDYDDLREVARKLHIPLWQVNAAEEERLRLLQLEAAASAGSRIAQTQMEMEKLAETVAYLGTRATENADLLASIGDEQFLRLGDQLLGFVDRYYKDVEGFEKFRLDLEQVRFDLEYANMQLQFQWLQNMGILTEAQIARIQGVLDYIEAHPPDLRNVFANDNTRERPDNRMAELAAAVDRLREAFAKAKDGITEFLQATARGELGGIAPAAGLDAARGQFESVIAKANAGNLAAFQQAPEAARNFIEVLKRYSPDLFQLELPRIQEMMRNLLLVNTVTDGTTTATETQEEQRRHRETVDTLSRGFGDLSGHAAAATRIEEQVLDELRLLRQQNQELTNRLARLESGKVGEKRAA